MPDPDYDLFLSHASEDKVWCETLAERLRNEGVRVWFDGWELQVGDHLEARINDGLEKSRKVVAVWTANYFRDDKVWTLAEGYAQQDKDILARERLLIPLLREDCKIKPTFRPLIYLDFRNDDDFDLRLRQLIEALDLPRRDFQFRDHDEIEFREHKLDPAAHGQRSYAPGRRFEDEVATLYRLLGFEVKQDILLSGVQVSLIAQQSIGGVLTKALVVCRSSGYTQDDLGLWFTAHRLAGRGMPGAQWVIVSLQNIDASMRTVLEGDGVRCITYAELLRDLVPLDNYVDGLIVLLCHKNIEFPRK